MTAEPILGVVARALDKVKLDAVLIGNAAAALHGAPVTTIDLDFLIRRTPGNTRKLKALADELDGVLLRPFYPVSGLVRLTRNPDNLQIDFMTAIHGVKSFESLRARAGDRWFGSAALRVASLADVIASKRAANRPADLAVLDILEATLHEINEPSAEKEAKPQGDARRPRKGK